MNSSRIILVVGLTLVASLVAGCSENATTISEEEIEVQKSEWVFNQLTRSELLGLEDRIASLCMENMGFSIHPPANPVITDADALLRYQYGVLLGPNPDTVDQVGYGDWIQGRPGSQAEIDESAEFYSLPQMEQDEYFQARWGEDRFLASIAPESDGDENEQPGMKTIVLPDGFIYEYPTDGCDGEALSLLYPDGVEDFKNAEALASISVFTSVESSPEFLKGLEKWSTCIADSGLGEYSHPFDILGEIEMQQYSLEREIEIANTDLACIIESNLNNIREDTFWSEVAAYYQEFETLVYSYREQAKTAVERGQDLIESGY